MKVLKVIFRVVVCWILFGTVIFTSEILYAQNRLPFQGVFQYAFPRLQNVPPYNSGMPFPVLIGYVYIDSFARTASEANLRNYLNALTYSDTSKIALSYLYQMDDYNPIKWFQYTISDPSGTKYKTAPIFFTHNFGRHMGSVYPDNGRSAAFFYSDYILDVMVTDTIPHNDTISAISKRVMGVSGYVLETIKGKVLPDCNNIYSTHSNNNNQAETSYSCVQFEYRPDRIRIPHASSLVKPDSLSVLPNGSSWIKKDKEYIVFLLYRDLHSTDSVYNYATLEPVYAYSTCASMYPVINGIVYDPNNDFGFGNNLTTDQFKAALKAKVQTIINHN